ncbi:Sperm motility kinase 2A [Tulasnella sp. JGI-2019a]|nr:Sperm motility kinase 2A [Tulasnella sp. JGI-2019a]
MKQFHATLGLKSGVGIEADLIAKWTTDTAEVDLIVSLQTVKHPQYRNGVIQVIDVVRCGILGAWLVMPKYTPLQSLSQMSPKEYHYLGLQIVEAVAFLHAERIAHRDLKPANIVVDLKQELSATRVYIIDFGNARRCASEYRCKGFQGTRGWTAPEVQDGVSWEPMSAYIWAMAKILLHFAALAGTPDQKMSNVVACREPSSRPSAASLFNALHPPLPRPTKRHQVSAELLRAKFQAMADKVRTQFGDEYSNGGVHPYT